jgi:hypothetical protein
MRSSGLTLPERFQAKWKPVRVKKMRQIKNLEPRFDSIEAEKAPADDRSRLYSRFDGQASFHSLDGKIWDRIVRYRETSPYRIYLYSIPQIPTTSTADVKRHRRNHVDSLLLGPLQSGRRVIRQKLRRELYGNFNCIKVRIFF